MTLKLRTTDIRHQEDDRVLKPFVVCHKLHRDQAGADDDEKQEDDDDSRALGRRISHRSKTPAGQATETANTGILKREQMLLHRFEQAGPCTSFEGRCITSPGPWPDEPKGQRASCGPCLWDHEDYEDRDLNAE